VAGDPGHRQDDDAGGTVGHDGHDRDDGMSGDQAAWRDLVSRLELPQYVDPATAPWPERENLSGSTASDTAADSATPDHDSRHSASAQRETAAGSNSGSAGSAAASRSGQGTGADRSRVIRPASFLPLAGESVSSASSSGQRGPAKHDDDPACPLAGDYAGYEAEVEAEADCEGNADFLGYDDLDDRYIPPPLPTPPKLDPVARGAWTALFGGPGYLFVATLLNWQVPGWAALAGIIAFVAGFTILVFRLGDGPSRRDGPDQGAVV
jgi:hypothetical protein